MDTRRLQNREGQLLIICGHFVGVIDDQKLHRTS
jgi:hypothetical protein